MSVAQHSARTFERQESKPGWFARLRESWRAARDLEVDDWTEPLKEPVRAEAPPAPKPAPRPVHPPFAPQPAKHVHVAIRMQRILVEASWDPELTPTKLAASLDPLVAELHALVTQEQNQPRRMERNQADVQAQAALLADAVRRGRDEDGLRQATEGIAGRAVHVADPVPTGVMPRITEDMADPRTEVTATVPADVNPGDVEPAVSPVHAESVIPVPSSPFVGGEGLVPKELPRRPRPRTDPEAGLPFEAHPGDPTTVLPVQGVTQTALLPVVGEARDDD